MNAALESARIGFIVSAGFQAMLFATLSVFEMANVCAGEARYRLEVLSEHGGPIHSSFGTPIETQALLNPAFDTLIFAGSLKPASGSDAVVEIARQAERRCRRIAALSAGAFTFAEAGILDARRATTHWQLAGELQRRYPRIKVEDDCVYVVDGRVWTSAGMSAGVDLALDMVERDCGPRLAQSVAENLVVYSRRRAGQPQRSAVLRMNVKSDRIQRALDHAQRNLRAPLTVEQLAMAARLSPRQFSRAFRAETGQSPAKAIEDLRLESARLMMEQTRHPVQVVAAETGFGDTERMRRAFLRHFGSSPQALRRDTRNRKGPSSVPAFGAHDAVAELLLDKHLKC
jgi:transcriptional regulator GlxA family with amidase domain